MQDLNGHSIWKKTWHKSGEREGSKESITTPIVQGNDHVTESKKDEATKEAACN